MYYICNLCKLWHLTLLVLLFFYFNFVSNILYLDWDNEKLHCIIYQTLFPPWLHLVPFPGFLSSCIKDEEGEKVTLQVMDWEEEPLSDTETSAFLTRWNFAFVLLITNHFAVDALPSQSIFGFLNKSQALVRRHIWTELVSEVFKKKICSMSQ
jgi:hypothetical protein